MKKMSFLFLILSFSFFISCVNKKTNSNILKFHKGYREDKEGWIFVHIEGEAYERGYQHGYLLADQYQKAFNCYKEMTMQMAAVSMDLIKKEAIKSKNKIPKEYILEMQGIANGISKRGYEVNLDDIIAWNAYIDVFEGWWGDAKSDYSSYIPLSVGRKKDRCSAFIATGSYTKDNKVVISHSTFDDFWNAQYGNVILDIKFENKKSLMFQTTAGFISSMTDFFVNSSGIVGLETSLSGFTGYNVNGTPSYVRQRNAMQYSNSIDEFVKYLNDDNNGGNAASWLIADINTNEIAKFEQGLKFQSIEKKRDGFFFGCNVAFDTFIRNLECNGEGYNDIRRHTGGRRVRFPVLLEKYKGKIDVEICKKIMSDHFDVYHKKNKAAANTICAHYDEDPRYSMSSIAAVHSDPYTPAGAVDCKITTSDLAKDMKILAIFGRPCSRKFNKDDFLKKHPQFNWQKDYLLSRPSTKYTYLESKK
jgi:hypothetical protein